MSSSSDVERAAQLLERLLTDREFRALFRQDPEGACLAHGFEEEADELADMSKALHTIEIRESRSSLAGAMLAAAAEAANAAQSLEQLDQHGSLDPKTGQAVHQALTGFYHAGERKPSSGGSAGHAAAGADETAPSTGGGGAAGASTTAPEPAGPVTPRRPVMSPPVTPEPTPTPAKAPDMAQTLVLPSVRPPSSSENATLVIPTAPDHSAASRAQDAPPAGAATTPTAADALANHGVAAPSSYPGDNAPKAAIAAWMARRAEAAGLPRELPIMAGLTESGLQNLNS